MADWRRLATLDLGDDLREAADEYQEERERAREEVHCHHQHEAAAEDRAKWALLGLVIGVVVIVAAVKLSKKFIDVTDN